MNTTSESGTSPGAAARRVAPLMALAALLALGACIQGPWDYYPENPPAFRGVFVTGYAVAGRPLQRMCFERMLDLAEEATEAFPFYDSADVRVTGSFGGQVKTLVLSPLPDTPNCFIGDTAALVDKGSEYDLNARLVWDSAGSQVASVITGTAHVPAEFSIHKTAAAPSIAKTGGVPPNLFAPGPDAVNRVLAFFGTLPQHAQEVMIREYGDTLVKIRSDTAKLNDYIRVNGQAITERLLGLLQQDLFTYHSGDTLVYLNGALNTLSHYFTSERSKDVKAVLVTQRFDPEGARPETRFDNPFGGKPDSSRYFFPGDHRRLIIYPDFPNNKGYNLLDSMGLVNTWFHTKLNRFYFYGTEKAYYDFNSTATQVQGGGAPSDGDPRVKPKYNVRGGIGIFVGAAVDSFDLNIRTDSLTKSYPLPVVHVLQCRDRGWTHNEDCRDFYPVHCASIDWKDPECYVDAGAACLEADMKGDTALAARCRPSADSSAKSPQAARAAAELFCIRNGFPAGNPSCAEPRSQCFEQAGPTPCKGTLWDYCKDNLWKPAQCGPALVVYCKDNNRPSETMCKRADAFCRDNPGEAVCK